MLNDAASLCYGTKWPTRWGLHVYGRYSLEWPCAIVGSEFDLGAFAIRRHCETAMWSYCPTSSCTLWTGRDYEHVHERIIA